MMQDPGKIHFTTYMVNVFFRIEPKVNVYYIS